MTPDTPTWRKLISRRMLFCMLAGFSSGLPLYVVLQLLPAWLRDQGVDLGKIGLMSLVGFPYTWKFVWSPLLDRYAPPLGRRRGWALLMQIACAAGIAALGFCDPKVSLTAISAIAALVAFGSATQDIVLDAWRRELLHDDELGFGSALFVNAYRVAGLVPGSLALILADHLPWSTVYPIVGAFMLVGVLATAVAPEVEEPEAPPTSLLDAIVSPFREFYARGGLRGSSTLLAFMFLYKLGDVMATALATPFYLDLGFTKTDIGTVSKLVGLTATVIGGLVGGAIMARIGMRRSLQWFGVAQMVPIVGFAWLAHVGPSITVLACVVAAENLGIGMGTTALVAFLQQATHRKFSATQFALFSSFVALPRMLAGATSGYLATALGWPTFFVMCTALALPGLALVGVVAPREPAR